MVVAVQNVNVSTSPLMQTSRVFQNGVQSTCAAPKAPPGIAQPGVQFRYRNHQFRSRLTDPVCITVDVDSSCVGVFSAAYIGTFDRLSPLTRYAADMGASAGYPAYSFTVPAGGVFSVVVHEVSTSCTDYDITVRSDGPWAFLNAPIIFGNPALGSTLTGGDADWVESPTIARRWLRCDTAGANCTDIPGATGTTYTVTDADLGHTIRFRNDATDAQGTNSSESDAVEPYIPFDTRATESLGPGDRVHLGLFARGSGEGRCSAPSTPATILNPTQSYLYDPFAVRSLLNEPVCVVARTTDTCSGVTPSIYNPVFEPASGLTTNYVAHTGNGFGQDGAVAAILPPAESREVIVSHQQPTGSCNGYSLTLGADAPFATARPGVSGRAVEGDALTARTGVWSGSPAFGFAWLRCDAGGAACVPVPGAAAQTYTPTAADVGSRMRVRVIATRGRSVSSDSEPSEVVAARPPVSPPPIEPLTGTVRLASRNLNVR